MSEDLGERRRSTAPPPPNSKERVAAARARSDQPKRKRGRPRKEDLGERPDEFAHLPPVAPKSHRQLVRADGTIDGDVLLDAFLANATPQQIQDMFGVAPDNFRSLLKAAADETLLYIDDLLNKLTLKNIARTERLMNTWMPLAQGMEVGGIEGVSEKAAKVVISLIGLERDLLKDAREEFAARSKADEGDAATLDDIARVLDRQIETTFTKGSPMYEFALSVIERSGGEELVEFDELVVHSDVAPTVETAPELDVVDLLKKLEQAGDTP